MNRIPKGYHLLINTIRMKFKEVGILLNYHMSIRTKGMSVKVAIKIQMEVIQIWICNQTVVKMIRILGIVLYLKLRNMLMSKAEYFLILIYYKMKRITTVITI